MRLIDADAIVIPCDFLEHFNDRIDGHVAYDLGRSVRKLIDAQPTVEPKRGHWITWFEDEDVRQAKCSECGMMFTLGKGREIHYCGNCGAKMDEVEE